MAKGNRSQMEIYRLGKGGKKNIKRKIWEWSGIAFSQKEIAELVSFFGGGEKIEKPSTKYYKGNAEIGLGQPPIGPS